MSDSVSKNLGPVTAYAAAKEGGYEGTKEDFEELLADFAEVGTDVNAYIDRTNERMSGIDTRMGSIEAEQAVQDARMDTFVALEDGSTTGDAELQDIRVGADGQTYSTAGDAVRGQIFDLKEDLDGNVEFVEYVFSESFGISPITAINGYDEDNATQTVNGDAPFIWNKSIGGNLIIGIKLNVLVAGTLSVGYLDAPIATGDTYDSEDLILTNEVHVSSTGEQIIRFPVPFVIPTNGAMFIGRKTDTAKWAYGTHGVDAGFWFAATSTYGYSGRSIGVDVFSLSLLDYKSMLEDYPNTKSMVDILAGDEYSDTTFSDGYSTSNASISNPTLAPFIVVPHNSGYVTSYKLNISIIGTLSIGTIKSQYVVGGHAFDFTNVVVHETHNFTLTGEQTHPLSEPMKVDNDEYIVIGVRTDTAEFLYGSYGVDVGFFYISGTNTIFTQSSIGVSFYGFKKNAGDISDSVYYGKTLSILGDSISTFAGYIPEGNAAYYPSGTVQAVTDTWWKKLIDALGMTLNVNNSWSGSRVTTTDGATSAGCGDRAEALGTSPDVIIVWMGINDFNNEVTLGTYDGTTSIPSTTTTFREAYGIMLNKILTKYQSAEVWVCTLPQCERNAETGFPEINGNGVALAEFNKAILELAVAFGVKVLDHNKCGLTYQNMPTYNPDNLHPNKLGHSLVANNDIRQMDNYIRTRY